jgi:hypothetical protein
MPQERRVRVRPRMSSPKLGEYLYAEAGRREKLLRDQKFPPAFQTARYADAENAIRASLVSGRDVVERLKESAQTVSSLVTTTDWRTVSKRCCVQAIHDFAALFPSIPTAGSEFSIPEKGGIVLNLEGVVVSVHPVALSRREVRGRERRGAILAIFQKTDPVGERPGKAVAELLRRALMQAGQPDLHPSECVVVDIFRKQIFTAPAQSQRVFANINSACREIAVRWPTITSAMAA